MKDMLKMNIKILLLGLCLSLFTARCATDPLGGPTTGATEADFSEFDKGADTVASAADSATNTANSAANEAQSQAAAAETKAEDSLEKELNEVQQTANDAAQAPADEMAQFEQETKQEPQTAPPPEIQPEPVPVAEAPAPAPPPPVVEQPTPVPPPEEPPPVQASNKPVVIERLLFKANDGGGTLAIEANGPIEYSTRTNPNTRQFVIEIPNAKLSKKAKRSLITKDFPGGIGAVDPYQAPGSSTARIVVQLREGASEPNVQAEGNALLVVSTGPISNPSVPPPTIPTTPVAEAGATASAEKVASGVSADDGMPEDPGVKSKILTSSSLQEFLAGNQKFYGKKISWEANDVEIRELLRFLSDESGINMVLGEDVKGRVSGRFRQVPWDQAFVVLLQSKKLGYVRQGDILRVSRIEDLRKEEEDFTKVVKAKQALLPLIVRMIPISYAKVEDIVKQVQPFLTERGKVVAESRTSAVVISDVEKAVERAQHLIASLDTAPSQVLIEGKIVEAQDTFQKFIGANFAFGGDDIEMGSNNKGAAIKSRFTGGTSSISTNSTTGGAGQLGFSISPLDFLGDLRAALSLGEATGEVRVLSSPRILTLHNEEAKISQTTEVVTILVTPPTTANALPTKTAQKSPVNLNLTVKPQITNDASVILDVDMTRQFPGEVVDPDSGARPINGRSAKTKVIVRNGQTAVIGGIYQSDSSMAETRVPGLANIPVLGWLFKNQRTSNNKNELLIFLTPRIVGQADSGLSVPPSMAPKNPEGENIKSDPELDL